MLNYLSQVTNILEMPLLLCIICLDFCSEGISGKPSLTTLFKIETTPCPQMTSLSIPLLSFTFFTTLTII